MRYAIGVLAAVVCLLPAWASEPGQPLDCSDMVFTVPGLTCVPFVPIGAGAGSAADLQSRGSNLVVDNLGGVLYVKQDEFSTIEVWRRDYRGDVLLASVGGRVSRYGRDGIHVRCWNGNCLRELPTALHFDPMSGRLLVWLNSRSSVEDGSVEDHRWIASIEGFATTPEILQTYPL